MKIFVTRKIPNTGIDILKSQPNLEIVVWSKNQPISKTALLKNVRGCDAILSLLTDKIDESVFMAAGPNLKIVANYAVGYDNIDLMAAKKHNVIVTNTPGVLTDAVAEHTFALILALTKKICEADHFTKSGKYCGWDPNLFIGSELQHKTIGLIGIGRIGTLVAKKAFLGMDMKIVYFDVKRDMEFETKYNAQFLTLDELLKQADFVSLHVPLIPSTHHLINQAKLMLMKSTAFLINTARGPIVNEADLIEALKSQTIAGAALDVFEHEPKISKELRKMTNVILTPHIASATMEARNEMARLAATSIVDVLCGKTPKHIV